MNALRKSDLARACTALEQNLREGREPVLNWLKTRAKVGGTKKDAVA